MCFYFPHIIFTVIFVNLLFTNDVTFVLYLIFFFRREDRKVVDFCTVNFFLHSYCKVFFSNYDDKNFLSFVVVFTIYEQEDCLTLLISLSVILNFIIFSNEDVTTYLVFNFLYNRSNIFFYYNLSNDSCFQSNTFINADRIFHSDYLSIIYDNMSSITFYSLKP